MADPNPSAGGKQAGDTNKQNQDDASEANKRTIANVQKNESDQEKAKPEYRPGS